MGMTGILGSTTLYYAILIVGLIGVIIFYTIYRRKQM
jgi:hypothetical protein